jgi:hypothetical protein
MQTTELRTHIVVASVFRVHCTCGFFFNALTASETRRIAAIHASENRPSIIIKDEREEHVVNPLEGCTIECLGHDGMGKYADHSTWHHLDCPNHTTACCEGRLTEEDYL